MAYKFIIIEGVDSCGKTTLAHQLASIRNGYTVFEPGSNSKLRQMILEERDAEIQLLLFLADRLAVHKIVKEYLEDSDVISDRGFPSSYVYQGMSLGNKVAKLHTLFSGSLIVPDRIYVLDIDLETFQERLRPKNRMDLVAIENFELLRSRYLNLEKVFPNVIVLDGRKPTCDLLDIIEDDLAGII
jgi:dTMP kinase